MHTTPLFARLLHYHLITDRAKTSDAVTGLIRPLLKRIDMQIL